MVSIQFNSNQLRKELENGEMSEFRMLDEQMAADNPGAFTQRGGDS